MEDQLHIIIAGDRGKVFKLPCSRKKIKIIAAISVTTLVVLITTSIFSISFFTRQHHSSDEVYKLQSELKKSKKQQQQLDIKIAKLKQSKAEQETAFKTEKENLISKAVSELTERSELIEEIVGSLGIKLPKKSSSNKQNSGGPFVADTAQQQDELIYRADKYLKTIRLLPLGTPVKGPITSRYGKRKDPMNSKSAFHTGIDFRGKRGEKIRATGDGVVKKAFKNGGYGNYVMIDHGNGYTTSFSHMQKYLVRRGDQIKRGQVIGLVGNTGRSTGPHLHYEVALDGRTVNPYNFMKIAKLKK
ncbi:MAG: murein DD-endopeptidase MepM/ murein hydrolase activator NlpD [Desulforhopalus sp.]|jgi:murein DD-endopeptidase MepM/ murein hydrolase activator NlpD